MSPRVLVVVEPLLLEVNPLHERLFHLSCRTRRWKTAATCWQFNAFHLSWVKDVCWRRGVRVDAITFQNPQLAEPMQAIFDRENIGVNYTIPYASPKALGQAMAYMPEVIAVVHAHPEVQMQVGLRGFNAAAANINGALL
jgi:hypothetical protein